MTSMANDGLISGMSAKRPKTACSPTLVRVAGIPSWMPAATAGALRKAASVRFRFSEAERTVFRRPAWLPPSRWAEKHRVVRMSSIPGKWRNIFTPYLAGIMDAARCDGVETVILCKTPQTGGSEAGMNLLGHMIEYAPGPAMVVFPDEITARENAQDRILPMIKDSPRLRRYLSGAETESSSIRINLRHMPVYLGWSGSVSRLGNKPIRTLILDELDKYQNPKKEATSESLAEKRTTTWKGKRFILKISTPTTEDGPIWTAFTAEANARFEYRCVCPYCGTERLMDADNIKVPVRETRLSDDDDGLPDPEDVLSGRLAWYECPDCGARWDDEDRDRAVRAGGWYERVTGAELFAYLRAERPRKIGFHVPAWISRFVELSEVARARVKYLKSRAIDDLKDYLNQYAALPWKPETEERREDTVLALCDERPRGAVPGYDGGRPRVSCLLAAVDTQKDYFRYVIRAFGWGEAGDSWLVQCGSAPGFEALEKVLFGSEYTDADGRAYRVSHVMIDAMGSRTSEVYAWALRHRGVVFPWQGVRRLTHPYQTSQLEWIDRPAGGKIRIPGGLTLYRCDVTFFKGDLASRLGIAPGDPGAFRLHGNGKHELDGYAKEMCAEIWDEAKQGWENPSGRPNHFWDCEVMARALAYVLNVRRLRRPEAAGDAGAGAGNGTPPADAGKRTETGWIGSGVGLFEK